MAEFIPSDVLYLIFASLSIEGLCRCECVCKKWKKLLNDTFWKRKYLQYFPEKPNLVVGWKGLFKDRYFIWKDDKFKRVKVIVQGSSPQKYYLLTFRG